MGSYCSCSGPLKFNNGVIIPKNSLNDKMEESIQNYSKEKNEKRTNKIKRFVTYSASSKPKKSERKKTILQQEKNSLFQVVLVCLNIKLFKIQK